MSDWIQKDQKGSLGMQIVSRMFGEKDPIERGIGHSMLNSNIEGSERIVAKADKKVQRLSKEKRRILADAQLPDDDKRKLLRPINRQIRAEMKWAKKMRKLSRRYAEPE